MTTRDLVIKEMNKIPEYLLEEVLKFIREKRDREIRKPKLHTFNLHGRFDDLNIREKAYE